ncbi:hypothetical protein LINPERPRIM_LOCUS22924 [Linum perenne]
MGADWGPVFIAVGLFILLSPGLLFQLPARERSVEFMNMKTSLPSMFAHLVIYALLLILFLVILDVHLYV